jgi:hypothetical protein
VTSAASNASGGRQPQHLPDLGRVERAEDHFLPALVERPLVRAQRLRHRQVRAGQHQQRRPAAELAVPRALQRTLERVDPVHQVRHFVDHHDAGPVIGQDPGQLPQRRAPVPGRRVSEHRPVRHRGRGDRLPQRLQLDIGRRAGRGEEHRRRIRPVGERLDQGSTCQSAGARG